MSPASAAPTSESSTTTAPEEDTESPREEVRSAATPPHVRGSMFAYTMPTPVTLNRDNILCDFTRSYYSAEEGGGRGVVMMFSFRVINVLVPWLNEQLLHFSHQSNVLCIPCVTDAV